MKSPIPLAKSYGCYMVIGDNYAGQFAQEPFLKAGMAYELAQKHKTQLYLDPFLSLLNSKRITLPKNERAIAQICALERSTKRSGRDEITHPSPTARTISPMSLLARLFWPSISLA